MTTDEQALPPTNVIYDFKGSADFSMIKGLPAMQTDEFYEDYFNDYIRVREIRDRILGSVGAPSQTAHQTPSGERVAPQGAPPQQRPPAAAQGPHNNPWPPTVVRTTNDDGTPTVGCSWHKKADGTPRPMRVWEEDTGLMKCTGKTTKSPDGFCVLTYQPKAAPRAEPVVVAGNLPF